MTWTIVKHPNMKAMLVGHHSARSVGWFEEESEAVAVRNALNLHESGLDEDGEVDLILQLARVESVEDIRMQTLQQRAAVAIRDLLQARQDLCKALRHVADEIAAQRRSGTLVDTHVMSRYWAQLEGVARDALAAVGSEGGQ
jgi:hypothetical protein